jgi:hypothetical protein
MSTCTGSLWVQLLLQRSSGVISNDLHTVDPFGFKQVRKVNTECHLVGVIAGDF